MSNMVLSCLFRRGSYRHVLGNLGVRVPILWSVLPGSPRPGRRHPCFQTFVCVTACRGAIKSFGRSMLRREMKVRRRLRLGSLTGLVASTFKHCVFLVLIALIDCYRVCCLDCRSLRNHFPKAAHNLCCRGLSTANR